MKKKISLLPHQLEFVQDTTTKYIAMVSGFGAGKSYSLCVKALHLASLNIGFTGCVLCPTLPMARDIIVPTLEDLFSSHELVFKYRVSPLPEFTVFFKQGAATIKIRSFETYKRLAGLNLSWCLIDEIDLVEPESLALAAFRMVQSRIRTGNVRQVGLVSTPEGYGFLYNQFKKEPLPDRRLIHARTYDNPFLPPDYIQSLLDTYPTNLINAYLEGQFVNLSSGNVYYNFDRFKNHTDITVEDLDRYDVLHIGQDFNVGKCSSTVFHIDEEGHPHQIDEFTSMNTENIISNINERYPDRHICIFPDASGNSGHSNATQTDLSLLRQAGYEVHCRSKNPRIRDRVNSVNAMFLNGKGERRLKINTKRCPTTTEALEQQGYDKFGMPDKSKGLDHTLDALGYFVYYNYPIQGRPTIYEY